MPWIARHVNLGRAAALVLLLAALLAPWAYTADGVPPAEWCHDPFILLDNGRCVGLVSGAWILRYSASALVTISAGLVTGAVMFAGRSTEILREALFLLILSLIGLPVLSALLQMRGGTARRAWVFFAAAWGLAALAILLILVSTPGLPPGRLWGIWLYLGSAAGAFALELLAARGASMKRN